MNRDPRWRWGVTGRGGRLLKRRKFYKETKRSEVGTLDENMGASRINLLGRRQRRIMTMDQTVDLGGGCLQRAQLPFKVATTNVKGERRFLV